MKALLLPKEALIKMKASDSISLRLRKKKNIQHSTIHNSVQETDKANSREECPNISFLGSPRNGCMQTAGHLVLESGGHPLGNGTSQVHRPPRLHFITCQRVAQDSLLTPEEGIMLFIQHFFSLLGRLIPNTIEVTSSCLDICAVINNCRLPTPPL